jgi:carboxyl-terminal processing protease
MRSSRKLFGLGALVALTAAGTWGLSSRTTHAPAAAPSPTAAATIGASARANAGASPEPSPQDGEREFVFRIPSGEPTALTCEDARRIVDQARTSIAYDPAPVEPAAFAESASDWLDPHALWALAPDAPTAHAMATHAAALVRELERPSPAGCKAADEVGAVLGDWVAQLRDAFEQGRADASADAWETAAAAALPSSGPALAAAREMGRRAGAVERALGGTVRAHVDAARDRFFPTLDRQAWGRVVLAASVRAYVPLIDPHGAWAPFDEEASVYEVELSTKPPARLWAKAVPTTLGVVVERGARAPLSDGDVVLALGSVPTAGLPLEQVEQLAYAVGDVRVPTEALVVRKGARAPVSLALAAEAHAEGDGDPPLEVDHVAYGDRQVLVVAFRDVRDDLGEELARTLSNEKDAAGVVLDLRGNGGGSTDGAIAALGLFMPGRPLFPMKRRDGSVQVDRAPDVSQDDRWGGPVATLVDGATASAAEMLAGALAVYRRGPSIGAQTYGKGCAQEYIDDDARAGVLRLTTLLFALPDGTPVQRVGLSPSLRISLSPTSPEREATIPHAPPTWRGPDVRDPAPHADEVEWPSHGGRVGPCKDADVCRALRALGPARRGPSARASAGR